MILSMIKGSSPSERSREFIMPIIEEHGICLKYQLGKWTVVVADYDELKPFLKDINTFPKRHMVFSKDFDVTNAPNILGTNKEVWKRQRKAANPAFHRRMPVATFGEVMKTMFRTIETDRIQYPDLASFNRRFALDCIGLGGFSFDMGSVADPNSEYATIYNEAFKIIQDPIQFLFPSFSKLPASWFAYRQKAVVASRKFRQLLTGIVETRKQAFIESLETGHNQELIDMDLLTMLINANLNQDGSSTYLTDSELISNLAIFYAAGHETTANALSSMLYYLAVNPKHQQRLREEVISIMGDAPEDAIPTDEQLRQMKFLECCIKESMRINPPTSGNQLRTAAEDTTLGNFFIPKGTDLGMDIWVTHHLEKYWKDSDTFNPSRFDKESSDYVDSTWMPFGAGERICIGMNFSLAEQRIFHAMFTRKYEYSLRPNSEHANGMVNAKAIFGLFGPQDLELSLKKRY
ncbi:hypothetical protein K450DRAFT_249249 [Umbelopsis ramanniana AG]|uniref:Cytochrome P450 n=1 Tax=Umbelopsis ramanniana AG TaxID=1314678 RepID=A0AAD5HCJ7_UMBRA|nr:uncharacterized protein K450DRAFT_249249 [Umbelopsis ramanniana AG]KAI8577964.1 hypothetical protein K450DRAFT_249249 [Umbelopsis ramanniana AG]